ncbi:MAG: T9SS type A sorting domain-containing protein [Flavobacteriia bacterium]|jgi:hypothetical protein
MKINKILFTVYCFLIILFCGNVIAQVTLYLEDFDNTPVNINGEGYNASPTLSMPDATSFTLSAPKGGMTTGDWFCVLNSRFEGNDLDLVQHWYSNPSINITDYTSVTISVDMGLPATYSEQYVFASYSVDGGSTYTEFGRIANNPANGTKTVSNGGTNSGSTFTKILTNGSTSLIVRVSHYGTNGSSLSFHDNVRVVGTAPSCTPASQASSFSLTSETATTATLSWTNGASSNGTVIVARPTASVSEPIANGITYLGSLPANSSYGTTQIGTSGNYVVYKGSGTSATITGLSASTNYTFVAYSYTSGTDDCYNITSAPSIAMTTDFCDIPASTASAINFSGITAGGMTINWTNSGSGNPVMVVVRPTFWPIDEPVIGTTYTANASYGTLAAQIGNGNYVVYRGTGNSVSVTGLHGGINYTVSIYEYVGTNCYNLLEASATQTTSFTGNIYYVDDASNTGDVFTPTAVGDNSNNGLTATTPKATLKNLITTYSGTFANGDIIYIDAGYYTTEISISLTASGLSFIGAGNDKTFFDRTASTAVATDWFIHVNGDNLIFKDFTCQGYENNGTQGSAYECGQAVTVGGDATFDNNIYFEDIIFNNNGQSGGNAALDILRNTSVYVKGGGSYCNVWETAYTGGIGVMGNNIGLTVESYVLAYNFKSGSYDGAGIRIEGNNTTNVKLKNVRIAKNKGVNGGGIGLVNGNLVVEDCIFEDNYAGQVLDNVYGAAIFISCGTAHIKRSKFTNNTTSSSGNGGAIGIYYNNAGAYGGVETVNLIVDSCLFSNNTNSASRDLYAAAPFDNTHYVTVLMRDCQFLTAGNFNIVNNEPAEVSISVTYFGTAPTNSGTVTKSLSSKVLYTPNPTVPGFTGVCGSIVLPVELSKFEVKCDVNSVEVDFETLSERNNDFFTIEKAGFDGVFNKIGEIDGSGNSSVKKEYHFVDYNALVGTSYYRLSQYDLNGKIEILDTKVLSNTCVESDNSSTCYYNALANEFVVQSDFSNNEQYTIYIIDALGKRLTQEEFIASNNLSSKKLKLTSQISNAIYFVIIESTSKQESIKVVKY